MEYISKINVTVVLKDVSVFRYTRFLGRMHLGKEGGKVRHSDCTPLSIANVVVVECFDPLALAAGFRDAVL